MDKKTEKRASVESKRLPKAKQKQLNALRRVPIAPPGHVMDAKRCVRQKRWSVED